MFAPSGFTALFTRKISVIYDKIEPVSIYNIQINI